MEGRRQRLLVFIFGALAITHLVQAQPPDQRGFSIYLFLIIASCSVFDT